MKDLPAIARYMRLPEEQLRFPVELLNQGYEPNYLATYRPDELGGIDVQTLARLKRSVAYEGKLAAHKERVHQALERDQHWSDAVAKVIDECTSVSQLDRALPSQQEKREDFFREQSQRRETRSSDLDVASGTAQGPACMGC